MYKGNVILKDKKGETELVLTNINLVFINIKKKTFEKEEVTVLEYPVDSVKMYEGMPQIKFKGAAVEIYLLDREIEFEFLSKIEAMKFNSATTKLLTGTTAAQRNAKKVKETIELVDDTLGIDSVQATGNVIKNGIAGSIAGAFGKVGKALIGKNKK